MKYDEAFPVLLKVARSHGFRPDLPLGMEQFLAILLEDYQGDLTELHGWLDEQLSTVFCSMVDRPRWLQDPEWPLSHGEPMVFVGQLDRKSGPMNVSFYVFKERKTGVTKVVTQVVGSVA